MNTLRRSLSGYKLPSYQRNLVAVLLINREFVIMEIPEQETEKDTNLEEKTNQIDQNKPIKQLPLWRKIVNFISKNTFLIFANILEYFVNRARFGLRVIRTFNIILIAFIVAEWLVYIMIFTEIIPNYLLKITQ